MIMDLQLVILLLIAFHHNSSALTLPPGHTCDNIANQARIDCHPDSLGSDQTNVREACLARGCCWREATGNTFPGADISAPWCFLPTTYDNYEIREHFESDEKITISLLKTSSIQSGFPNDSSHLTVTVSSISDDIVRIKIIDALHNRFEVPAPILNDHPVPAENKKYVVSFDEQFGKVKVVRKSTYKTVFAFDVKKIIYSQYFLELTNEEVPSKSLYGLGESMDNFRKDFDKAFKKVIMLNSDQPPTRNLPLYGTHPFYLMRENERDSHGVLFFNNHIQEVVMAPKPAITYRTTGGVLDFFIFMGPSNNEVMSQKMNLIGHTPLPPLWSFGYQLCRYGYKNTAHVKAVYDRTIEAGIPLDVKWVDIDYMKNHNDFTVDEEGDFKGLGDFVKQIRSSGRKFIPILDPAVSASEPKGTYPPYDDGIDMDIFIRNEDGSHFIGHVWNPETSIFPDFTHPRAAEYWVRQMKHLYEKLPYDGMWIDMNEPANMANGNKDKGCDEKNTLNNPPFVPGADKELTMYKKTVCPSAKQHLGNHFDLHNMYGFFESKATYEALREINSTARPFIVSRATVTGQNIYANHWTGDVFSSFDHLKNSVQDILSINLFGIPMVGADICGFLEDTTVELCARWQALGAFYPFSRNHNSIDRVDQDPVALGQVVVDATKNSLKIRYTLLPYFYTVFYENSITGHPVVRAPFWDHPWDTEAEQQAENQFIWGTSVMIIPALEQGKSDVRGYLPSQSKWYDYESLTVLKHEHDENREYWFHVPWEKIPVALKGKSVIAYHTDSKMTVTEQKEASPFGLIVALSSTAEATGQLFWDDGETIDTVLLGSYSLIDFKAEAKTLKSTIKNYGYKLKPLVEIKVLGVDTKVTEVTLNGNKIETYNYDSDKKLLTINSLSQELGEAFTVTWN